MDNIDTELRRKRDVAIGCLRRCGSVVVALSGGVDSAVLLVLAVEALGPDRVVAVTGRSAAVPERDLEDARGVAEQIGVRHEVLDTAELQRQAYRENAGDRCFHCRSELFEGLRRFADERGFRRVVYGAIRDDLGDHRPGMQAAERLGVLAPLLDAGLGKPDVRRLAAEAGLAVRDKPAEACLASRIPVGTEVTEARLKQVERAEAALRDLGFLQLRARHHGDVARLELDAASFARLADPQLRERVGRAVRSAGFRYVAADLDGYRTGSLNPVSVSGVDGKPPARDTGQ